MEPLNNWELERQLVQLNHRYAHCLDEEKIEDWPDFFSEDCKYLIQSQENARLGLDGYLLYFDSKAMLRDRVTSLREANFYSIQQNRHFISGVTLAGGADGLYQAYASYMVIQTDVEGRARVFSVGKYIDQVLLTPGGLKLKERRVIVDNFNIEGMIAFPL